MAEGLSRRIPLPEQMELALIVPVVLPPLPEILTLREFVAQMERQYGDRLDLRALRAAMEETKDE